MARSIRKGPHIDMKLLKKVHKMEEASNKSVIKTWARNRSEEHTSELQSHS